jgi:hypothetical protein
MQLPTNTPLYVPQAKRQQQQQNTLNGYTTLISCAQRQPFEEYFFDRKMQLATKTGGLQAAALLGQ